MSVKLQDTPRANGRFGTFVLAVASLAMLIALLSLVRSCSMSDDSARSQGNAPIDDQLVPTPGPPGETGPPGATGEAGATGASGVAGATGARGPRGPKGADGTSVSSEVNGAPGTQGIQGLMGPQGIIGPQGEAGPTGPQGEVGPTGIQGPPGASRGINIGDDCIFEHNSGALNDGVVAWVYGGNKAFLQCVATP